VHFHPANNAKPEEEVMKTLAMAIARAAFSATSAIAQSFFPYYNYPHGLPQGSMFGTDPITHVTTSFRTAIVTAAMDDAKAQETARRTLYAMAENECAILSEIFQAECRLGSFAI
jgi:hypothetical protein